MFYNSNQTRSNIENSDYNLSNMSIAKNFFQCINQAN